MKISSSEIIESFYNEYKDKYPELSFDDFKLICTTPWIFIKEQMESGELPSIRLKYFGIFKVYEGRAKDMYNKLEDRYKNKSINEKQYNRLKTMLENFLNKDEK